MAIFIPDGLPAVFVLRNENTDIRPYKNEINKNVDKILILNLMPTKQATETQLIRMLSCSKKDIAVYLMNTASYTSRNTDSEYLNKFYHDFSFYKDLFFDGLIVTGAPVEHLEFEDVLYWNELCRIFRWAETNVRKIYTICWGAQAALMYYYGIKKYPLSEKMFGIFEHRLLCPDDPLCKGLPLTFFAPHSRHSEVRAADIEKCPDLDLLSVSDKAGVLWAASHDRKISFVTGHPEYDATTLSSEYFRDIDKGEKIRCPENYFPNDDPSLPPPLTWRDTAKIIYSNWTDL